jgi:hypothetical protein
MSTPAPAVPPPPKDYPFAVFTDAETLIMLILGLDTLSYATNPQIAELGRRWELEQSMGRKPEDITEEEFDQLRADVADKRDMFLEILQTVAQQHAIEVSGATTRQPAPA